MRNKFGAVDVGD